MADNEDEARKYERLLEILKGLKRLAVMYSGGVDSFFLLHAAAEALGRENVLALTFDTDFFAKCELDHAKTGIKKIRVRHIVLKTDMLSDENIRRNDEYRCFYCKKRLLSAARTAAREYGFERVADGTNASDLLDTRPGLKALGETGVLSPLKDAGLLKEEIVRLLYKKGYFEVVRLPDACLASRISTGEALSVEKLRQVEQAENFIKIMGYALVRVRCRGGNAAVELEAGDIGRFKKNHWPKVKTKLEKLGFTNVSVSEKGCARDGLKKVY